MYHLGQGHIVSWLYAIGEKELAKELRAVRSIAEAQRRIQKYKERSVIMLRMQSGCMHLVC